jgi:hypothetical protein
MLLTQPHRADYSVNTTTSMHKQQASAAHRSHSAVHPLNCDSDAWRTRRPRWRPQPQSQHISLHRRA